MTPAPGIEPGGPKGHAFQACAIPLCDAGMKKYIRSGLLSLSWD